MMISILTRPTFKDRHVPFEIVYRVSLETFDNRLHSMFDYSLKARASDRFY